MNDFLKKRVFSISKKIPDKLYLQLVYRYMMKQKLPLKKPITFNEKLQWLKLYDKNSIYSILVDKVAVRDYISKNFDENLLFPLLGVWKNPNEINYDELPNQFVLKCNHDSGSVIVCRDKEKLDKEYVKRYFDERLKREYFYYWRERPYKYVEPKILAEKYMADEHGELTDYKFMCFDGYVDNVMVCVDRHTGNTKFYFFNKDWQLKKYNKSSLSLPDDFKIEKPALMDEMFEIASRLSKGFPFVRIDLYCMNNKIYFGEYTFYPQGGYDANILPEADIALGNLIKI